MNHFLEVAIDAAREAGAILRAEFDRPKKISYKGDVDIVTESDKRSEAAIVARLRSHFPSHAIVGEEGSEGTTPEKGARGAKYTWHVDPLDGTTNFAHGYPCFAVSIGLVEDGEPIAAAVLNPIADELFTAARGEGAYLGQKRIRVSEIEKLSTSLVATGFPTHARNSSVNINYYWEFTLRSHGVRRDGSAALDLASVAAGRFDGFWEFGLKPWDTAAGVLLIEEAGGTVSDFAGQPYQLVGPVILATNGLIHEEARGVALEISQRDPAAPLRR
jgi:myo-inositol-1(or 4)-monophosphatase